MGEPFHAMIDQVPLKRVYEAGDLVSQWNAEYDKNVTNVVYVATPQYGYYNQYGQHASYNSSMREYAGSYQGKQWGAADNRGNQWVTPNVNPRMSWDKNDTADPIMDDTKTMGSVARSSELSKTERSVTQMLARRDLLDEALEKLEQRQLDLETAGAAIPDALMKVIHETVSELDDLEQELDGLESLGSLTKEQRYESLYGLPDNEKID
jgi:hypothetical protein